MTPPSRPSLVAVLALGLAAGCVRVPDESPGDPDAACPTYYPDRDGDGYGDDRYAVGTCTAPPAGWITTGGDCFDTSRFIHPDAPEVCDGLDNDCDLAFETGCPDGCDVLLFDGSRYLRCVTNLTWHDAHTLCLAQGYELAQVEDRTPEYDFIASSWSGYVWIADDAIEDGRCRALVSGGFIREYACGDSSLMRTACERTAEMECPSC
jgi:hypothetical protein